MINESTYSIRKTRLIDADALKDNMFHYAAPEMVWDRGDIEHKINEMPTIDAIPVEWLRDMKVVVSFDHGIFINWLIHEWQKKQEAQI